MEKEDCLKREDFAVPDICALIDYHSRQWLNKPEEDRSNISFAIDGEWGCGKSFVLEMVEEKLKKEKTNNGLEDRYVVFHYNCWEYDYYDEPLVAIVSMMIEQIESEKIFSQEEKKKFVAVLKTAAVVAVSCLNAQLEAKTKINFNDLIQNLKAAEDGKTWRIKSIKEYDPLWEFKRALNLLKKQIAEIAQKRTVVFVVDELDRCLPEYAIKVLERLHHISEGVNNLITVIAVDKSRLLDSISNAFGYDKGEGFKDSERYMKKFVDFYYLLDNGSLYRSNTYVKYKNYIILFDNEIFDCEIIFSTYISELFKGIDMREQEKIIEKAMMIHNVASDQIYSFSNYLEECNLKYDQTVMYTELLLTWLHSHYNIEINNLHSYITDFQIEDNLQGFRQEYFNEANKKTNKTSQIIEWYLAFLKSFCFIFNGMLPAAVESSDGISRDTSEIKEKYGIDMEENLKFLYSFYGILIRLS